MLPRTINFNLIMPFIRVNTLKISINKFLSITKLPIKRTPLPYAFKLTKPIKIGKTFEYITGLIHPQSLSSMIPPLALSLKEKLSILDATASPGSKTTQIAMEINDYGAILANDRKERLRAIRGNLKRLGITSVALSSFDAKKIPFKDYFDRVLIDPPCTALGAHENAFKRFKEDVAKALSRVQKSMLLSSFDALKPGGILVYSTCTITKEENEEVISFLLEKRDNAKLEIINIDYDIKHDNGISDYGNEFRKVWRIYPEHNNSEAFFIAKIKKIMR